MTEWKPEDFEEGASIIMSHWNKAMKKGAFTKEDVMAMLADVANAIELAEMRHTERAHADKVAGGRVLTIPVGTTASTW